MLRRCAAALLLAALAGAPNLVRADATAGFSALAAQFVSESERRDPLFADSIGIHEYDDALDDYTPAGHARRIAWLRDWRARLANAAAGDAPLSRDDAADAHALLDTIDLELFEDATLAPTHTDPTAYTSIIGNAAYMLTGRAYAPLAQRFPHLLRRVALIPGVVDAAEAMLTHPTRVATLQAIDENAGNAELYRGLTALARDPGIPPAQRAALRAELPATLTAIDAFGRYLKSTLLPRSNANPRVGAAVFDRELLLANGTTATRAQLVADARAAFAHDRAEMLALALPFDRKFFPDRVGDERKPDAEDVVVRRVLDRLADDHPSRDAIFATASGDVRAAEAFLTAHPVVVLPQPPTLRVVPTPEFMAGFSGASLDPAGPFTPLAGSYYYIDRIPRAWSAARVRSYLRDFNAYELRMLSIHEAVPGHYVQFRYNASVPSLVRRVFANGSFVEGWAVYTEGMMLDAGYAGGDPRQRLFQLKWRLREETNTIVDAAFHAGSLTEAQCDDLLEREAYQERSEAQTKWHRLQLSHDQLTSYFVGLDAIRHAEAAERARLGNAFTVAGFNAALLNMGSVEPRDIETLIAPPPSPTPAPIPQPS
jgi:uncharacterized protein (DUF885 family)